LNGVLNSIVICLFFFFFFYLLFIIYPCGCFSFSIFFFLNLIGMIHVVPAYLTEIIRKMVNWDDPCILQSQTETADAMVYWALRYQSCWLDF
jgi:hypothetical protein